MVLKKKDPLTGAHRDHVFVAEEDARRLGVADGDPVVVRSDHGEMTARVKVTGMKPGNVQVFFPEGNVLLPTGVRDPDALIPDFNAVVRLEPAREVQPA
ncbi:MAG: molybdopterin dinucleotide binding domain-containing protein [Actinomycetota bacterium]